MNPTPNRSRPGIPGRALFWCFCVGLLLQAQEQEVRFNHLSVQDGLPHPSVFDVAQDPNGFIWLATRGGLARFDGARFRTVKLSEDGDKPSISVLLVDVTGEVWVGTWGHGLARFNPQTGVSTWFRHNPDDPDSLSADMVQSLFQDRRGRLWVGTPHSGLNLLVQGGRFQRFAMDRVATEAPHGRIWDIRQAEEDSLWLATSAGLVHFEMSGEQHYLTIEQGLPNNLVNGLDWDESGSLWISTVNGLARRDGTGEIHPYLDTRDPAHPLLRNYYRDVAVDHDGMVWLASPTNGLKRFDPTTETFRHFRHQIRDRWSLSQNKLEVLFVDRAGSLWVGGRRAGLDLLHKSWTPFQFYESRPTPTSLSHNEINVLLEAKNGGIWVGTNGGGLDFLDPERTWFRHHRAQDPRPDGLSLDNIGALAPALEDGPWVGTQDGVIQKFIPGDGSFRRFFRLPSLNRTGGNRIWSILEQRGVLWVASDLGLARYDLEKQRLTQVSQGVADLRIQRVYSIFKDSRETLWIAGQYGLFQVSPEGVAMARAFDGVHRAMVCYSICEDNQGRLWLGGDEGLWRFDPKRRDCYPVAADTLGTRSIYNIAASQDGALWLLTDSALIRYQPENGGTRKIDHADGLLSNQFHAKSLAVTQKGEVFVGGSSGLNSFSPQGLKDDTTPPAVYITSLKRNGRELTPGKLMYADGEQIRLPFGTNTLTLNFAALNYIHPERNRYQFRLKGWDEDWREVAQDREVSYTNLPPGKYLFRVKASNHNGTWNEAGTGLTLRIVPPFFRTTFFLVIMLLLGLTLLWLWRRNSRRHEQKLARKVDEQTRSLRDTNARLRTTAEDLRRTQAELIESAHRAGMAEVASDVLHNIGNALTSLQVSASMIETRVGAFRLDFLKNLAELLATEAHRLPAFFAEKRGRLVPEALSKLAYKMELTRDELQAEIKLLHEQIFQINEIVISQRDYTFVSNFFEPVDIRAMLEDVLRFQEVKMEEFHIEVIRAYGDLPSIRGAKAILLHIFNHLIRNAMEALSASPRGSRSLTIRSLIGNRKDVVVEIEDTGVGIDPGDLTVIFSQNWSGRGNTKKGNLHYCANAISGMGGSLSAKSRGLGKGAVFILEIPRDPKGRDHGAMDKRSGYDR